jgi:hypothetical protein
MNTKLEPLSSTLSFSLRIKIFTKGFSLKEHVSKKLCSKYSSWSQMIASQNVQFVLTMIRYKSIKIKSKLTSPIKRLEEGVSGMGLFSKKLCSPTIQKCTFQPFSVRKWETIKQYHLKDLRNILKISAMVIRQNMEAMIFLKTCSSL